MTLYKWSVILYLGMIISESSAMWKDQDEEDEEDYASWNYDIHGKDWSL